MPRLKKMITAAQVMILAGAAVLGWQAPAMAQTTLQLEDYHGARAMFRSQERTEEYSLALGSYRKIEGIWQSEREQRLSGVLTRVTYELPENHTAEAGFEFYLSRLQAMDKRELFSCKARSCGASNAWANNHFKILQLYGQDQNQFYAAYEVNRPGSSPAYVSLYAVQRGNKRVYVQVDILNSDKVGDDVVATNPQTLINVLQSKGYYVFPDVVVDGADGKPSLQSGEKHLTSLVRVLQQHPAWRIALTGHDYHGKNLAEQQQYSLTYANQLKAALVAKGVNAARIETHGLGSLAPAGRSGMGGRVEVVLLP